MNVPIKPEELHEWIHRIQGKTVVIAGLHGASHGVGVEAAHLFAENGAKVVLADVDTHALAGVVHAVKAAGGHAVHKVTDVRRPEQVEELFKFTAETFGHVDVVINVAGLGGEISAILTESQKESLSDPTILGVHHVTNIGLNWLMQNPSTDLKSLVMVNTPGINNVRLKVARIVKTLVPLYEGKGIKLGSVFPWFHDLANFTAEIKEMIGHVESPSLPQIALASLYLATDPKHDGCLLILTELASTDMVEYGAIDQMKAEFIAEMKGETSGEAAKKPPSPWMKFFQHDGDGHQPEMPPIMAKFLQKKSTGDGEERRSHRESFSGGADKGEFRSEIESIKREISGAKDSNAQNLGAEAGLKKRSPDGFDRKEFFAEFEQIKKEIGQDKAEMRGEQVEEGECPHLASLPPAEAAAARARVTDGNEEVSGDASKCPHLASTGGEGRPKGAPGAASKRAPRGGPGAGDSSESDSESGKKAPRPPSFGGGGKPGFGRGKPKSDSESEGEEEPKKSGFAKFGGGGGIPSFGGRSKSAESGDESESEAPSRKSGFAKFGGGGNKPGFGGRSKKGEEGAPVEKESGFAKFGGGGGKPGFGGRSRQSSDSEGETIPAEKKSGFAKFGGGGKPGFGSRSKKAAESDEEETPTPESKKSKFGGGGKPSFDPRKKKEAEDSDGQKKSGFAKFGGGGGKPGFGGKPKGDGSSESEGRKSNFAKFSKL
jgi:hypothetical protein